MCPIERYNHTYHHRHCYRQCCRRRDEKHDDLLVLYSLRDGRSSQNRPRHHPRYRNETDDTGRQLYMVGVWGRTSFVLL
jgi:hypothetical protein